MKRLVLLSALLPLLLSCGGRTPDPVHEAIKGEIMGNMSQEFTDVTIHLVEKIDSTTFRTELEHRKDVFRVKQQAEEKLYLKYSNEHKPKTAESHRLAMEKAVANLAFVEGLEQQLAARLDDIAYYDYVFSGYSQTSEGRMTYDNVYVTVTPACEVLTMTANAKDLHKGTGRVIPGYLEGITSEE